MICVYCQKMAVAIHAQLCHFDSLCNIVIVVLVFACQVTVKLVEEYIKPEEMVILCVILAMSDFGNAEAAGCGSV